MLTALFIIEVFKVILLLINFRGKLLNKWGLLMMA